MACAGDNNPWSDPAFLPLLQGQGSSHPSFIHASFILYLSTPHSVLGTVLGAGTSGSTTQGLVPSVLVTVISKEEQKPTPRQLR